MNFNEFDFENFDFDSKLKIQIVQEKDKKKTFYLQNKDGITTSKKISLKKKLKTLEEVHFKYILINLI
jgi:hypothetical protein